MTISDITSVVVQPIDAEAPPIQCGHKGCEREAISIAHVPYRGQVIHLTACGQHEETAAKAVAQIMCDSAP